MIEDVVRLLACPLCRQELHSGGPALRCAAGHAFDLARQGYANLLPGGARPGTADTAEMVAARARFQQAGHYAPIAGRVAAHAARAAAGVDGGVVDVGAGTGYYLARVLEELPGRAGLALDLSTYAARRAARCHSRAGAVVADAWQPLPVRGGAAAVVLDVFAPRSPAELRRVLAPGGSLVLVTPTSEHLAELVGPLGLLAVDERKAERVGQALGGVLRFVDEEVVRVPLRLSPAEAGDLVGMGPSAWHGDAAARRERIAELGEPVAVTAAVRVATYRREE